MARPGRDDAAWEAAPQSPYHMGAAERRDREHDAARSALKRAIRARRTVFGQTLHSPRSVFQALDRDRDGQVTPEELADGLKRLGLGLSDAQLKDLGRHVDADGDGQISWEELAAFIGSEEPEPRELEPEPEPERTPRGGGGSRQQRREPERRRQSPDRQRRTPSPVHRLRAEQRGTFGTRTNVGSYSTTGTTRPPEPQGQEPELRMALALRNSSRNGGRSSGSRPHTQTRSGGTTPRANGGAGSYTASAVATRKLATPRARPAEDSYASQQVSPGGTRQGFATMESFQGTVSPAATLYP